MLRCCELVWSRGVRWGRQVKTQPPPSSIPEITIPALRCYFLSPKTQAGLQSEEGITHPWWAELIAQHRAVLLSDATLWEGCGIT